jgi:hypothetical protein
MEITNLANYVGKKFELNGEPIEKGLSKEEIKKKAKVPPGITLANVKNTTRTECNPTVQ